MSIPDYTLRYSLKAKYLQLRISGRGLEVVVPGKRAVSQTVIEQFLQEKKSWIVRNWKRWVQVQEKCEVMPLQLPESIFLRGIQQTWDVVYWATAASKIRCIANQSKQIKLLGNMANQKECVRLLRNWLKKIAEQYFRERLQVLSVKHGLSFNQLNIRHTITRWGSCSSDKNISLCCKLLFLPPHLVDHVLLHELCHTKVMSHGVRFWKLLGKLDPDCEVNKVELKKAGGYVPGWAR